MPIHHPSMSHMLDVEFYINKHDWWLHMHFFHCHVALKIFVAGFIPALPPRCSLFSASTSSLHLSSHAPTCLPQLVQPPLSMHFALIRREHRQTVLTVSARRGCCRGRETTAIVTVYRFEDTEKGVWVEGEMPQVCKVTLNKMTEIDTGGTGGAGGRQVTLFEWRSLESHLIILSDSIPSDVYFKLVHWLHTSTELLFQA